MLPQTLILIAGKTRLDGTMQSTEEQRLDLLVSRRGILRTNAKDPLY